MSNCEQIAQIAHNKWATVSDSLRSFMINERMSKSIVFFIESLIRSFALSLTKKHEWFAQKKLTKIVILVRFWLFCNFCFFIKNSYSLIPSFFNEQCEQIAQVAHQKWELWANCSGCSPKMSKWANRLLSLVFFEGITHYSLIFLQKTSDLPRKPWENSQSCLCPLKFCPTLLLYYTVNFGLIDV